MTVEAASLLVVLFVVAAAAVGYYVGRWTRREIIAAAAEHSLDVLRARQAAEDRRASRALPPTVTLSDAYAYAQEHGLGIEEAAARIHVDRARAIIEANLRRGTLRRAVLDTTEPAESEPVPHRTDRP